MSATSSSDVTRSYMRIAADEIVGVCDGTPGAHDAMIRLCRGIAERTSDRGLEPTAAHLAMLSAATELARLGARIIHIDIDSTPPTFTVDPKYLHWVARPALYERRYFSLSLNGARVEWTCWP